MKKRDVYEILTLKGMSALVLTISSLTSNTRYWGFNPRSHDLLERKMFGNIHFKFGYPICWKNISLPTMSFTVRPINFAYPNLFVLTLLPWHLISAAKTMSCTTRTQFSHGTFALLEWPVEYRENQFSFHPSSLITWLNIVMLCSRSSPKVKNRVHTLSKSHHIVFSPNCRK